MPYFRAAEDPGSNFPELLRRLGFGIPAATGGGGLEPHAVPHATTCVALRYDEGVVMAGDRRATAADLLARLGS